MFLAVLIFYIVVGAWMEKKNFKICHETGVIITVGAAFSMVVSILDSEASNTLRIDRHMLFDVFLPLIIFATSYNMRRKNFFENIINVSKFGIIGTLITFLVFSGPTLCLFSMKTYIGIDY